MKKILLFLGAIFLSNLAFSQITYTFNGNGNWSDSVNWLNRKVPPSVLPFGDTILLSPSNAGQCILDIPQIIQEGAFFKILPGKNFIVKDKLLITDPASASQSDTLSSDIKALLDTIGAPNPTLQQMLGYEGTPLGRLSQRSNSILSENILKDKIDSMLRYAQSLSGQKTHLYPSQGINKPEHYGLVYSFGQRNFINRLNPPCTPNVPPGSHCDIYHQQQAVYGLDCSGFLYQLMKYVGIEITLPVNVAIFYDKANLALKKANLKLQNLGKLDVADIKSGDIIKWSGHIGLISDLGNLGKIVFQSNGDETPGSEQEQLRNLGLSRGVHPLKLLGMIQPAPNWGNNYEILRLTETFTDPRDNQVYTIKKIGTQVWMTQNLNFSAPSSICYNYNTANCIIYGKLYNWNTALSAAPTGWHLPSDAEWQTLINYLGGDLTAGGKMKIDLLRKWILL